MAYDAEFYDGFDKYGPTGSQTVATLIAAGEWNTVTTAAGGVTVTPALASAGYALRVAGNNVGALRGVSKTLPGNYARIIGGMHVKSPLTGAQIGLAFGDAGTDQLTILVNATTGTVQVRRGTHAGTILGTSTEALVASVTAVMEWDVTFSQTVGIVKIWLDGVLTSLDLSGLDTCATTNAYANTFLVGTINPGIMEIDHLYLWMFASAGTADTPALTNPVVETQFPTSDDAVNFAFGSAVVGDCYRATANTNSPGANQLVLRKVTPQVNCTLDSVAILPQSTNATAKFKAVIYSNNAGAPNALLDTGPEVTGCASGTTLTMALTTPQSLLAGIDYWIGYIANTSITIAQVDAGTDGQRAANTYTSGAPATAPTMTAGQPSWMIYGNVSGLGVNWPSLDDNPPSGDLSYVSSATVNDQDTYGFPALAINPTTIYSVAVKPYLARTDAGARTMDLLMKSGAATGVGDTSGFAPPTSYGFRASYFKTDPNTGAAWSAVALNSAKSGYKIAS